MGPGGQQQRQKREQKAEAEAAVRCGAVDAVGGCCCSYRRDSRQSMRATVDNQQGGERTTRGVSKENVRRWAFDTRLRDDGCGSDGQTGEVRF